MSPNFYKKRSHSLLTKFVENKETTRNSEHR